MKRNEGEYERDRKERNHTQHSLLSPSVPSPSSEVSMEMNWLNLWQDVAGSADPQKPVLPLSL